MTMCKKLIILCAVLVVVGLTVKAPAAYVGQCIKDGCISNPLLVDIQNSEPTKCNWQGWNFGWNWTGPVSQTFVNPQAEEYWEVPSAEIDSWRSPGASGPAAGINDGGSRNRSGGFTFVAGTGEFQSTAKGFGMNYLKLTVSNLAPETSYRVYLWSYEAEGVWSANSANPASKYAAWSTTNPKTWLEANGYAPGERDTEPNGGYGPLVGSFPISESNMPCGLKDLSERVFVMAPPNDDNDYLGSLDYRATFCDIDTDADGRLTLYGWMDATDWTGSMHVPLNGFFIVPEPATVALLGLGGLALIRRRKR
jgi:hypothetical protein